MSPIESSLVRVLAVFVLYVLYLTYRVEWLAYKIEKLKGKR